MNKINGFDPENPDYVCALFCSTPNCSILCTALCYFPQAYYGNFVMGANTFPTSSYWINYELNG